MAWDRAFEALMDSTMKVRSFSGVSTDGYLTPTFASSTKTWRARFVRKQELVKTFVGTEETSAAVAWVRSTSTFGPSDKVTINGSTIGPMLAVAHYPDEDGHHHSKVWWG